MANLFTRPHLPAASVLALAGGLWVSPAAALELVAGGYGQAPTEQAAAAALPDERVNVGRGDEISGMSLEFTPRHAAGAVAGGAAPSGPRFDFGVRGAAGALDQLGLVDGPSVLNPAGRGAAGAGLTVGGAMHWHDWSIGGGLGQADFLGTEVDLFSATLGYGRLNAEIAYGQASGQQAEPGDVLMLSTDLAASSWLTLESDLALGSRPDVRREREDESVAVGRLGLRLNF